MEADLTLSLILVAGFLLGLFRGPVRQLLALGVVLVSFVIAVYLRPPVGDWIATQALDYSREYNEMLGFGLAFVVLVGVGVFVVQLIGATTHLTRRVTLDAILAGLLGLGLVVLTLACFMIVLDSYYATEPSGGGSQLGFVRELNIALGNSAIARAVHENVVPILLTVFGPILPPDLRALAA